jgi:hypothetical protein
MSQYNFHTSFHQILGHVTTIRSALSVLTEDYQKQLPPDIFQMIIIIQQHTEQLKNELLETKDRIYKMTEHQQ